MNNQCKTALNTSTLIPFQLSILEQIEVTAAAGYDGVEIWMKDVEDHLSNGGTLQEIRKMLNEKNLIPSNAIAFWKWADQDHAERDKGLKQAQKELEWLAEIGCQAVAAPPFGSVDTVSLDEMADHFSTLTSLARRYDVEPYLEFWGRAKKLSTLREAVCIARKSNVHNPKIVIDPFHMYTGGSEFEELNDLRAEEIGIVHVNDYPNHPPQDVIQDKHRLFPGDGLVPSTLIATSLFNAGYTGYLSLELFIEDYHHQSALEVAKKGLVKMKNAYSVH